MGPFRLSLCFLLTASACKVSLLATARAMSGSCNGAFTAEVGMAVAQKTVNDSGAVPFPVCIRPVSCHEPCHDKSFFWFVECTYTNILVICIYTCIYTHIQTILSIYMLVYMFASSGSN